MTEQEIYKYNPINEKGDFIERDCIFSAHGILYAYTGVIHDDELVFGRITLLNNTHHLPEPLPDVILNEQDVGNIDNIILN